MKLKNRHWWQIGRTRYKRADFTLKVLIGAADLKFQIWGKNALLSKDHDDIIVQWDPPRGGTGAQKRQNEEGGFFQNS
jgi:hypothetical protein